MQYSKKKLDSTFSESQLILPGMRKPFRLDVTSKKGGLIVFVNNDIPAKYLWSFHLPIYQPPDQNLDYFLSSITDLLDHYLTSYEDFVIMGDFNANESNPAMETFLNQHKCKNIIKSKTCYKSQEGSCIDLIITSRHSLHQFFHVFETEISDHPLMVYTMLKSKYTKLEPKMLRKRSYKDFNKESFLRDLQHGLNNIGNFTKFNDPFKALLDHHEPIKQSKLSCNKTTH